MARYKVIKDFKDKYTGQIYEANKEIEMTVKRAKEVEGHEKAPFLERVEEAK